MLPLRALLSIAFGTCMVGAAQAQIAVRVWNYAGTNTEVVSAAEAEVSHIFDLAGVQLRWSEGRIQRHSPDDPVPPANDDLVLRIKSRSPDTGAFGVGVLGRAFNPGLIDVYDVEIRHISRALGIPLYRVYAVAILHEFGHALLGPGAHAGGGPMHPRWDTSDFCAAGRGLRFTKSQSRQIRAAVDTRVGERSQTPASGAE